MAFATFRYECLDAGSQVSLSSHEVIVLAAHTSTRVVCAYSCQRCANLA
jgi:hypothetical protein